MATLDDCGAVVIPDSEPGTQFTCWGQETISALPKPLHSGPRVELKVNRELKLYDLDLDEHTIAVFQERAEALFNQNTAYAKEALEHAGNICSKIYNHHANSVNSTCDGLRVFWKCFQVNDFNIRKTSKIPDAYHLQAFIQAGHC